jgi:hypothetical protein
MALETKVTLTLHFSCFPDVRFLYLAGKRGQKMDQSQGFYLQITTETYRKAGISSGVATFFGARPRKHDDRPNKY